MKEGKICKKLLSLLLSCVIIFLCLPIALAQDLTEAELDALFSVTETDSSDNASPVDLSEYTMDEINSDSQLLQQYLSELRDEYDNVVIESPEEIQLLLNELEQTNQEISKLLDAKMVFDEVNVLMDSAQNAIQSDNAMSEITDSTYEDIVSNGESTDVSQQEKIASTDENGLQESDVVSISEEPQDDTNNLAVSSSIPSYDSFETKEEQQASLLTESQIQDAIRSLEQLDQTELSELKNQLAEYQEQKIEKPLEEKYSICDTIEQELDRLGAIPTDEELQNIVFGAKNLSQEATVGAPSDIVDFDNDVAASAVVTASSTPDIDLNHFREAFYITACYHNVTVQNYVGVSQTYRTYSVTFSDKAPAYNTLHRAYPAVVVLEGVYTNPEEAKDFLYEKGKTIISGLIGTAISQLPPVGAIVGDIIEYTASELLDNYWYDRPGRREPFYSGNGHHVKVDNHSTMRYVYVEDGGEWYLSNSAQKCWSREKHTISYNYYDCYAGITKTQDIDYAFENMFYGSFDSALSDAAAYYACGQFTAMTPPLHSKALDEIKIAGRKGKERKILKQRASLPLLIRQQN